MLTFRQKQIYTHLCDIWGVIRESNADSSPKDDVYQIIYTNVPCYYQYTDNIDDPNGAGALGKRRTELTTDKLHVPLSITNPDDSTEIPLLLTDQWFSVNRTDNLNINQVHRFQGSARVITGSVNMPTNKQIIQIMQETHPPAEIAGYYGFPIRRKGVAT